MPSNEIFSRLLKKSFDILDETSKGSRGINRGDLDNLLNLVREKKETEKRSRAEKLFGAARASQKPRMSDAEDLRHYRDPFYSPPKSEPKKKITKELKTQVKRKIQHSTVDYGAEQKRIRKKQSAVMFVRMFYLVIAITALTYWGMQS